MEGGGVEAWRVWGVEGVEFIVIGYTTLAALVYCLCGSGAWPPFTYKLHRDSRYASDSEAKDFEIQTPASKSKQTKPASKKAYAFVCILTYILLRPELDRTAGKAGEAGSSGSRTLAWKLLAAEPPTLLEACKQLKARENPCA